MGLSVGIDVGGTFTDFIQVDAEGVVNVLKVPSVPERPADGVLAGLNRLAQRNGSLQSYLQDVDLIVHGTTITTNAVLTRRYAKTGYITTHGLRDILNSRRGLKRQAFTAKEAPPQPIVPQHLVRTVLERLDRHGQVVTPLDEEELRAIAGDFRRENIEAVAICFMFSFLNPMHEERAKTILESELPDAYVTISSRVLPQIRFYERGSTTVFNACVGPLLRRYIDALQGKLAEAGFRGRLLTMQSNGGVMSPEVVKEFGANTLLSGPASGPVAGVYYSKQHNLQNLITIDMGGTSLDVCLVRGGQASVTNLSEVAEYALAIPSLDINAIGAGGGSIASVSNGGLLQVGPDSAGAVPGPAAYGLGGERATVTDANLVLGYINPDYFLGGEKRLDTERATLAVTQDVGKPLGLNAQDAALGIVNIVDSQMSNGVRAVSVARGFDPREACLIAAGGAGPLHACGIADELDVQLILIPTASSVLCAAGMLTTNLRQDLTQYVSLALSDTGAAAMRLNQVCQMLRKRGEQLLTEQNIPRDRWRLEFTCDMQFQGQFNVLPTRQSVLDGAPIAEQEIAEIQEAYERNHDRTYGYVIDGAPVEIQSVRLSAIGIREPPTLRKIAKADGSGSAKPKAARRAWFASEPIETPVYEGAGLLGGHEIEGPAIIEQPTTTIKIAPAWTSKVDDFGNLLLWRKSASLPDVLTRLQSTLVM